MIGRKDHARVGTRMMVAIIASVSIVATTTPSSAGTPEKQVADALAEALRDEYRSRDTYRAVLEKHGSIRPFSRIVEAEQRHIEALLRQFDRLGIEPPEPSTEAYAVPATRRQACIEAAAAERANAAMYDRLLQQAGSDAKVVETFERLREASLERHLRAFERCSEGKGHKH